MWHVKYFSKGLLNMPGYLLEEMLTFLRLNHPRSYILIK